MSSYGTLSLFDRTFEVRAADIRLADDNTWSVEIDAERLIFDDEAWQPRSSSRLRQHYVLRAAREWPDRLELDRLMRSILRRAVFGHVLLNCRCEANIHAG